MQSIDFAKAYYTEFKKQQKDLPDDQKLKVATIFSYAANEEVGDDAFMDDENNEDTELLDASSRDFLESTRYVRLAPVSSLRKDRAFRKSEISASRLHENRAQAFLRLDLVKPLCSRADRLKSSTSIYAPAT